MSCKAATWSPLLCSVCMCVWVRICVAMCEKVGNSWDCGCWKEEILYPRVWLCTANHCVSFDHIHMCLLQYANEFVLAQSVCVSAPVCLHTLMRELCSYAYSLPPAPIHPHTFMYAHNWMKLSTFGVLIPSEDWGHLLAIDTAGDAIWGHYTPPCAISIQTGQQSSPRVHTNDRGQGKQWDSMLQCPAPAPVVEGGHMSSLYIGLVAVPLLELWLPRHIEMVVVVRTFVVFFSKK